VDHLHPDWAIAIAASANGRRKLEEFNQKFGRKIVWVPWQRPGFDLGLQLEKAVTESPGCHGVLLGSHGLFTWGNTQRECYLNSIRTIDEMGEFILQHQAGKQDPFGGVEVAPLHDRHSIATRILPSLRGLVSSNRRAIAHYSDDQDALTFAGSKWCKELGDLGTSCPDHFLRTKIKPMFVPWRPEQEGLETLKTRLEERTREYRQEYAAYYKQWAEQNSPKLRDSNPSVVIIPGLGIFGFGKNKKEARITTEFFLNAIHVMAGANALDEGRSEGPYPQARKAEQSGDFATCQNYVALPRSEAFRIEYWALEEAKLQRMPPESELSRKIFLIIGGGSGIGKEVALLLAKKGAHLVIADMNEHAAQDVSREAANVSSSDAVSFIRLNLSDSESIAAAGKHAALHFGGLDGIVNTAAIFPVGSDSKGQLSDEQWDLTFRVNITGNYFVARETGWIFKDQRLTGAIVLTSSANAVVPKAGSEAYDISKTALNHLIHELAVGLGPLVRVNGVAPATVVAGSTMFPRDRVIQSLQKYKVEFSEAESTEELRAKLADFYAQRTITRSPILAEDCAKAIVWLASEESAKTTGHVIPVDGGLPEAFLR